MTREQMVKAMRYLGALDGRGTEPCRSSDPAYVQAFRANRFARNLRAALWSNG